MKKILFVLALVFGVFTLNAQTISCDGTYIMTEPNDGLKIKECCVSIYDDYVTFHLFDLEVASPIYSKKNVVYNDISGTVYYIDKETMSYVFYGKSDSNAVLCVVSVITMEGRYTFVRTVSNYLADGLY